MVCLETGFGKGRVRMRCNEKEVPSEKVGVASKLKGKQRDSRASDVSNERRDVVFNCHNESTEERD